MNSVVVVFMNIICMNVEMIAMISMIVKASFIVLLLDQATCVMFEQQVH